MKINEQEIELVSENRGRERAHLEVKSHVLRGKLSPKHSFWYIFRDAPFFWKMMSEIKCMKCFLKINELYEMNCKMFSTLWKQVWHAIYKLSKQYTRMIINIKVLSLVNWCFCGEYWISSIKDLKFFQQYGCHSCPKNGIQF